MLFPQITMRNVRRPFQHRGREIKEVVLETEKTTRAGSSRTIESNSNGSIAFSRFATRGYTCVKLRRGNFEAERDRRGKIACVTLSDPLEDISCCTRIIARLVISDLQHLKVDVESSFGIYNGNVNYTSFSSSICCQIYLLNS